MKSKVSLHPSSHNPWEDPLLATMLQDLRVTPSLFQTHLQVPINFVCQILWEGGNTLAIPLAIVHLVSQKNHSKKTLVLSIFIAHIPPPCCDDVDTVVCWQCTYCDVSSAHCRIMMCDSL